MAKLYEYKLNSINDFFIKRLLNYNEDISKKAPKEEMKSLLRKFISEYVDESELQHFDFDIKNSKNGLKVTANNFGSALFFNNIMPTNFSVINTQEELVVNDKIYSFDPKKKKLNIKNKWIN